MDSFISKITLYDIISTTLPGLIVVLGIISIIPNEFSYLYEYINNAWFIFGLFYVVSYCTGWILSQLTKYIFKLFFEKNNCIYIVAIFNCVVSLIGLICLFCNFIEVDRFVKCALLYVLFIYTIPLINYHSSKKREDNKLSEKRF